MTGPMLMRIIANATILAGLFLLGRVICQAASGGLTAQDPTRPPGLRAYGLHALGLSLPGPMHVLAVGLIRQKKRRARGWARLAWWAVVFSGCWLGAALLFQLAYLPTA